MTVILVVVMIVFGIAAIIAFAANKTNLGIAFMSIALIAFAALLIIAGSSG